MCEQSRVSSLKYLTWQICDLRWIVTKVNWHIFSKCILTLSIAKPFFSYLCAIWLFSHIGGTQDRNPRQDVTVLASAVQLLNTKETPQFWVTRCFRKEVQVVGRNVTIAIIDSSTRGKLVLTSKMGSNSEHILISWEWWKRAQVKGANWLLLHQTRWTSLLDNVQLRNFALSCILVIEMSYIRLH